MPYNPNKHDRRSIRLKGYDYTSPGAYFITLCTHQRQCFFGDIVDGVMHLNEWGQIVQRVWLAIPTHNPHVALDEFVVMPNHLHGILIITGRGEAFAAENSAHTDNFHANASPLGPIPGSSPNTDNFHVNASPLGPIPGSSPNTDNSHANASPLGPIPGSSPNVADFDAYPSLGTGEAFALESPGNNTSFAANASPLRSPPDRSNHRPNGTQPGSIGAILQTFKANTTRRINRIAQNQGRTLWQRNYYEHIVRHQDALQAIRAYIQQNPRSWATDQLSPK